MELEHIDQLLSKDNLTRVDLHGWLQEHPLMLKETSNLSNYERHLPNVDENDDKPQSIAKQQSIKYVKNEGNFLAKFINNSYNHNNNNNTTNNKSNQSKPVTVENKSFGKKLFLHSKSSTSGKSKRSRSISAHSLGISYLRRKLSTSSAGFAKD